MGSFCGVDPNIFVAEFCGADPKIFAGGFCETDPNTEFWEGAPKAGTPELPKPDPMFPKEGFSVFCAAPNGLDDPKFVPNAAGVVVVEELRVAAPNAGGDVAPTPPKAGATGLAANKEDPAAEDPPPNAVVGLDPNAGVC